MTKALFRKLHSIESTIVGMTGVIVISTGSPWWGLLFVIIGILGSFGYESIIKAYEEEGYKFSDE